MSDDKIISQEELVEATQRFLAAFKQAVEAAADAYIAAWGAALRNFAEGATPTPEGDDKP